MWWFFIEPQGFLKNHLRTIFFCVGNNTAKQWHYESCYCCYMCVVTVQKYTHRTHCVSKYKNRVKTFIKSLTQCVKNERWASSNKEREREHPAHVSLLWKCCSSGWMSHGADPVRCRGRRAAEEEERKERESSSFFFFRVTLWRSTSWPHDLKDSPQGPHLPVELKTRRKRENITRLRAALVITDFLLLLLLLLPFQPRLEGHLTQGHEATSSHDCFSFFEKCSRFF